jgi:hypothetical protein
MKVRVLLCVCAIVAANDPAATHAQEKWSSTGHQHITAGAIGHLPQPLKGFFQANSATVVSAAGQEPQGYTHYIDIDYYPEFFAGTFPHSEAALVAIYGQSVVDSNGTGPWSMALFTNNLTSAMANAHTETAWTNLLQTAGALAHFVEDLHNPLHLAMNYDGQDTGNDGIHSRYESYMISRHVPADLPIVPTPSHCLYYPSLLDEIFDRIDVNYWYVDDIMAADDAASALDPRYRTTYYNELWADTGPFTQVLFQQASEMVASAWYTAWVNAGSPMPMPAPVIPGDTNCDGLINGNDIQPFVLAVVSPTQYTGQYPSCNILSADINSSGTITTADVAPFVQLLLGN